MVKSRQSGFCGSVLNAGKYMLVLAAVIGAVTATAQAKLLHPNHVTLAEMEFNPKTGNLEVSLCVHCEDLEQVLEQLYLEAKKSDETFRFDESSVDGYAPEWLAKHFTVRNLAKGAKQMKPIRWVGCELDVKKAWLFFEVQLDGVKQLQLENRLFFKLNEDQTNHVKLKHGKRLNWYQANRKQAMIEIEL